MSDENKALADKVREFEARTGETVESFPGGRENTANILGEKRRLSPPLSEDEAKLAMSARSRRGFLVGGIAAAAAILGWRAISPETRAAVAERAFRLNERVSQFFFSPARLAPEFPLSAVTAARVNGDAGLTAPLEPSQWRLELRSAGGDVSLTIDDIKALPRTEMVTELKCIEGWSTIVHWAGVRFSDFVGRYTPWTRGEELPRYVSLSTPDENYFVGWDIEAIMHPQTLLAYEMNGEPLKPEHGAPLRLASPTKYGIKQIKRIGRIEFTNERPRDYWNQSGYDWYSGH